MLEAHIDMPVGWKVFQEKYVGPWQEKAESG